MERENDRSSDGKRRHLRERRERRSAGAPERERRVPPAPAATPLAKKETATAGASAGATKREPLKSMETRRRPSDATGDRTATKTRAKALTKKCLLLAAEGKEDEGEAMEPKKGADEDAVVDQDEANKGPTSRSRRKIRMRQKRRKKRGGAGTEQQQGLEVEGETKKRCKKRKTTTTTTTTTTMKKKEKERRGGALR